MCPWIPQIAQFLQNSANNKEAQYAEFPILCELTVAKLMANSKESQFIQVKFEVFLACTATVFERFRFLCQCRAVALPLKSNCLSSNKVQFAQICDGNRLIHIHRRERSRRRQIGGGLHLEKKWCKIFY